MVKISAPFIGILTLALVGCEAGRRPVMQAQFCLTKQHGAAEFKSEVQAIARDEGMDFFSAGDRAESMSTSLDDQDNGATNTLPHGFTLAVRNSDDSDGFSASVSGPPSNQVMMGFSEGRDRIVSMAFAKRVLSRLSLKWHVRPVSGQVGMFPLKDCSSK